MRKITYLFLFSLFTISVNLTGQNRVKLITNFEDGSVFFDEHGPNLTMEVVANPSLSDVNSSNHVLKITGTDSHESWEGLYTKNDMTTLQYNINETDGYRYLHFKTYKDFTSQMAWGFYPDADGNGVLDDFRVTESKTNQTLNAWEYVIVDLLHFQHESWSISPGTYYRFHFEMTRGMNPRGAFTGYIDDIYLSSSRDEIVGGETSVDEKEVSRSISVSRIGNGKFAINNKDGLKETAKLEIFNMQGQLIQSLWSPAANSFEISLPTSGLYVLRVTDGSDVYTIKF